MKRCLACIRQSVIDIRPVLDEKLAQLPVSVEYRTIEIEILAERVQRCPAGHQITDCTDIAVVCTPLHERHAASVHGVRSVTLCQGVEHQVGTPIRDPLEHRTTSSTELTCRCRCNGSDARKTEMRPGSDAATGQPRPPLVRRTRCLMCRTAACSSPA